MDGGREFQVNTLAEERGTDWFRRNVITNVPWPNLGSGRQVYPGFLQLSGFMTMNLDRHMQAQKDMTVSVLHDQTVTVKNDRTATVTQNEKLTVEKGSRTIAVSQGDETHDVKGKRDVTVTGNETHTNKADYTANVTGNFTLKVSGAVIASNGLAALIYWFQSRLSARKSARQASPLEE
jgi:hypothetical protein